MYLRESGSAQKLNKATLSTDGEENAGVSYEARHEQHVCKNVKPRDFPGGQWLRIHLPVLGMRVLALVGELGACVPWGTKPVHHDEGPALPKIRNKKLKPGYSSHWWLRW